MHTVCILRTNVSNYFSNECINQSILFLGDGLGGFGKVVQDFLAFFDIIAVDTNIHIGFSNVGFIHTVNDNAALAFVFRIVCGNLLQQVYCASEKRSVATATKETNSETVLFLEQIEGHQGRAAARDCNRGGGEEG
jgi:hypothetical protein